MALNIQGYLRALAMAFGKPKCETNVIPILEYSSAVWDPHTQANTDKLESIQRKAVKFIFNT